jgi:hypothetical protein
MKLKIPRGTVSKLARVYIQDSSSSVGAPLTGLVFNSAGLTWYYIEEGSASPTAVTLATMTVGTWASGGFKEIDATHMPGWYEIGIPNAALDFGASVAMHLMGATNMVQTPLEIELDSNAHQPIKA